MTPQTATVTDAPAAAVPATARLVSLDAFRGATMALMMLVNNAGRRPPSYCRWSTPSGTAGRITDMVFPSFVWIVGVAITLSLGRRLARGDSRAGLLSQAARRAAVLFVLGLLVYAFPHSISATQRILGVLQRIAICYLVASAIFLSTGVRGQIVWIVGADGRLLDADGVGPRSGIRRRAPGRGRQLRALHRPHRARRPQLRHTKTWDPEGIVSTLPAIATCLLGVLAGHILACGAPCRERAACAVRLGAICCSPPD